MTTRWASHVAVLAREPASTVICCDFDGTIADIVADPQTARAKPATLRSLVAIAGRFQAVAVISGRPVSFLVAALGTEVAAVVELFGRYGAERRTADGAVELPAVAPGVRAQFAEIAAAARRVAPGVRVEDKFGSLALHWRESPDAGERLIELARSAVAAGLDVRPGKQMVDFVLPGAPTKGTVMTMLLGGRTRCGCFLGDDVGDLETFDALDAFEASGGTGLRIAVASAEMPEALRERADLILRDPGEAAEFLADVAAAAAPS